MTEISDNAVGWLMLALVLSICGLDAMLYVHYGVESTFSRVLRHAAEEWGFLPYIVAFAFGALMAHLFWPN